jgi:hypothetical protein
MVAKKLGGTRNTRGGDFGKSGPDVLHPLFSVEVKHRKLLPQLLRLGLEQAHGYDLTKPPLLVIREKYKHGALVVLKLSDFEDLFGKLHPREGDDDD